jgi:hypothetical protein
MRRFFSGLTEHEIILGAAPYEVHRLLLSGYLLNLWRGPGVVREMIIDDLHMSVACGALKRAADLLIVLRRFLSDYPEARRNQISL